MDSVPWIPDLLQPGDVLLYRPAKLRAGLASWFFGKVISIKTWTDISHCECYIGPGQSLAARDGVGVNLYPLRTADLGYVLRPKGPLNIERGLAWFYKNACGQKYDWLGLMVFAHAVKQGDPNKSFCSEFVARLFDRGFHYPLFSWMWDSDRVSPSMLASSVNLELIWNDGGAL